MARTAKATSDTGDDSVKTTPKTKPANKRQDVVEDMDVKKTKEIKEEPLLDTDEVEVMAIVPNVTYFDKLTSDTYEWQNSGDIEVMTMEVLTRMRRNHRGYFDNMVLKPLDKRAIKKLGLERTYDKYDFFMDDSNYADDKIEELMDEMVKLRTNDMKIAVINKVKDMVSNGKITNIRVLRNIENRFGIDLISYI